jgi:hypothetical protein
MNNKEAPFIHSQYPLLFFVSSSLAIAAWDCSITVPNCSLHVLGLMKHATSWVLFSILSLMFPSYLHKFCFQICYFAKCETQQTLIFKSGHAEIQACDLEAISLPDRYTLQAPYCHRFRDNPCVRGQNYGIWWAMNCSLTSSGAYEATQCTLPIPKIFNVKRTSTSHRILTR